ITFKGGGKTHLCYELHVTNFSRTTCVLNRVNVMAAGAAKTPLATYTGDELGSRVVRPGVAATTTEEKLKVGAGLRMVVHLWLTFYSAAEAPAALEHELIFKVGDYPEELSIQCARVAVSKEPIVISPPLRGSEWLAGNGPSNTSAHRRALIPTAGGAHIAQRF